MHMFLLFPCYTQHAGITTGPVLRVLQCLHVYKLGSFVYLQIVSSGCSNRSLLLVTDLKPEVLAGNVAVIKISGKIMCIIEKE